MAAKLAADLTLGTAADRSLSVSVTVAAGDTLDLNEIAKKVKVVVTVNGAPVDTYPTYIGALLSATKATQDAAWFASKGLVLSATSACALSAAGELTFADARNLSLRISAAHSIAA